MAVFSTARPFEFTERQVRRNRNLVSHCDFFGLVQMGRATIKMNRAEVEKAIEPIIRKCRKKFAPGSSETADSPDTNEPLRPEIRRVSLIASLTESILGRDFVGRGLEVGSGYGCLLFPMASLFPKIQWFAIEHPDQPHAGRQSYRTMFRSYNCHLETADLLREPFPFFNDYFDWSPFPRFWNICPLTA